MVNEQLASDPVPDSKRRFDENRYHQILTKHLHLLLSLYVLVKRASPAFFIPEVIFGNDLSGWVKYLRALVGKFVGGAQLPSC